MNKTSHSRNRIFRRWQSSAGPGAIRVWWIELSETRKIQNKRQNKKQDAGFDGFCIFHWLIPPKI